MDLVRKWPFSKIFFLGSIGQENVFYDILQRKSNFPGYKNKKFKKKIDIFPKMAIFATSGDNPWFWSKKANFSNILFFRQYRPGKCLLRYQFLNEKTPFEAIKTRLSKKSKNWHFSKGVNPWFWSKNGHFSNFIF